MRTQAAALRANNLAMNKKQNRKSYVVRRRSSCISPRWQIVIRLTEILAQPVLKAMTIIVVAYLELHSGSPPALATLLSVEWLKAK